MVERASALLAETSSILDSLLVTRKYSAVNSDTYLKE